MNGYKKRRIYLAGFRRLWGIIPMGGLWLNLYFLVTVHDLNG
jgi:hypothetical protein